jgi:hypothetical protein
MQYIDEAKSHADAALSLVQDAAALAEEARDAYDEVVHCVDPDNAESVDIQDAGIAADRADSCYIDMCAVKDECDLILALARDVKYEAKTNGKYCRKIKKLVRKTRSAHRKVKNLLTTTFKLAFNACRYARTVVS